MSAVYVAGITRAMRAAGLLEQVLAKVSPETRRIVDNPYGARWHPARYGAELITAVLELAGPKAVEDLVFRVARESFGNIVGTMVRIAVSVADPSPSTVFSQIDRALASATQGIVATWEKTDDHSGTMHFEYPVVAPPFTDFTWRGSLRFMFELAGVEGDIAPCERDDGGRTLHFPITWKTPASAQRYLPAK